MPFSFKQSLAFLFGFGFALLPGYGPFLSIIFFAQTRVFRKESLGLWAMAALMLSVPLAPHSLAAACFSVLQVVAPLAIFTAFTQLPRLRLVTDNTKATTWGLFAGLSLAVVLGALNIDRFDFAYKSLSQAIVWQGHPALYGHTVLVLGALVALLSRALSFRLLALAVAGLGVLLSGSREAALAWVFLSVVFLIADNHSWRRRLLGFSMAAIMLALSIGLGTRLGWGNVGFLLDIVPSTEQSNLIQGSEIAEGDWWDTSFTNFESTRVSLGGKDLTLYEVSKLGSEQWLRLQQIVAIEPEKVYTASVWLQLQPEGVQRPGIQGWSKTLEGEDFVVSGQFNKGVWYTSLTGQGTIIDAGITEQENDWYRVFVSFIYEGPTEKLNWYVGLTPDQRDYADSSTRFAGFQLEQSFLSAYTPGTASRGLSLAIARIPFWQAAWEGSAEKPLWGHGLQSFADYYQTRADEQGQLQALPAHEHNLYLQLLFERGLFGLLGLFFFILALSIQAIRQRDGLFLAVMAAVLFINFFDISLFYGGVLYPLAAIAGWRASVEHQAQLDSRSQQWVVKVVLASVDFAVMYLLLLLATRLFQALGYGSLGVPQSLIYALLLWPAMAWREGLYPAYGVSAAQELKKQVSAAFYAALVLAAGTLLFEQLALPRFVLLVLSAGAIFLLPLGRFMAKSLLLSLDLWGKAVIILGANTLGQRVASALINNRYNGLNPLAVFDDAQDKQTAIIAGLPVLGYFSDVESFAKENNIYHAIIAVNSNLKALPNFHSGSSIKTVQYVPNFEVMPSEGVVASSLDGLLALEVRLGLQSSVNRWVKRMLDLVCSMLLILILSPVFLGLYIWVRLDSKGPAFYKSKRVGQYGESFDCIKFRTMHLDADEKLEAILKANPAMKREYELYHKLEDDPRLTTIGPLLRKYSLDEFPQLFNVLLGQMSLIGPRPYLESEKQVMGQSQETILAAKPGMTGYWQISARNTVSFEERLQMEAYYVRNWSIWWDIIILMNTPLAVLKKRGQ